MRYSTFLLFFFLLLKGAIVAIIDIFILTILAILWPHFKRRMHSTLEKLAILWRHIKCRMHRHGHSSRPVTSTISDGRQR